MNNLFTSKGGVTVFLLLIFQFGLRLEASAHIRMTCDTDTAVTRKAKSSRIIQSDTTLILKAGSTIVKNADTILIINGVVTKVSINSAGIQKDPGTNISNDAASVLNNTTTIAAPPTNGTIQVRNLTNTPANTTIVAPPTDGVIQVRDGAGAKPTNTTIVAPPANDATQGQNTTTSPVTDGANPNKNTTTSPAANDTNPAKNNDPAATAEKDTTTIKKPDAASDAATTIATPPQNGVIQVKNPDSIATSKTDTTLIKKSDSTLMKKTDTTAMQSDTTDSSQVKAKGYFLEVGGAGLAISANYDTRLNPQRDGWGYRIGLGGFISGGNRVVTVPFQVNYLIGEHSSMFEVGAGTTFMSSTGDNKGKTWEFDKITGFVATGSIGYRYQPEHKGINFRIAFVPILYDEGLIPAGGISIGYTFK